MKKPLGELYSGGPERSLEAELKLTPENEEAEKLMQLIEVGRGRIEQMREIVQKYIEDLNLIKEKTEAIPLKMRLAAENNGADLEKMADEFSELQAFPREIEQRMKEAMRVMNSYQEEIKKLELKLSEAKRHPNIGHA